MKQRTITLKWHHVFGTANTYCLRLLYRGQPVHMITTQGFGVSIDPVTAQALTWAANHGYTHWREADRPRRVMRIGN
jgi:hypothetical protein